jgi:lipoprotein-anchoring transpeptidase ErfK/SrfK
LVIYYFYPEKQLPEDIYPNEKDMAYAKRHHKFPGGDIKIYGLRNKTGKIGKSRRWKDRTLGCIALTNREIDELYNAVPVGTVIEINP